MQAQRRLILLALPPIAVLLGLAWVLSACTSRTPSPVNGTVPVPQTQVVIQTRAVDTPVLSTAAPSPSPSPAPVSHGDEPPGTLRYPLSSDPVNLDPQTYADGAAGLVAAQIYDGLFNPGVNGAPVPAAATGYERSPDGKAYTVTLRSGLVWSDGRPLGAQDFVAGACRLLDPAVGSPAAYLLTEAAGVQGARDYAAGAQPDCSNVGLHAVDARRLVIRLERPLAAFPQILASRAFFPARLDRVGPATVTAQASETSVTITPTGTPARSATPLPVGNGPYLLSGWQPGDQLTLVKNPAYWAAGDVSIERIEMPILAGPGAQLLAYESGRLHIAEVAPNVITGSLRSELHILPQLGTSYLGLNTALTPTSDIRFRRALVAAIDRQALLENVLDEPWHRAASTLLPPGILGPEAGATITTTGPAAASQLLAQAGYTSDNPPPAVNIWANREGHNLRLAEGIAEMLEKAGIPSRLTTSAWDTYQRTLQTCQRLETATAAQSGAESVPGDCGYNVYLLGWLMDYADPARFLDGAMGFRPATLYSNWTSQQYDALLAEARSENDPNRRSQLYAQAEQLLLHNVVDMPLFHYDRAILAKPGLRFDYPLIGLPHLANWKLAG